MNWINNKINSEQKEIAEIHYKKWLNEQKQKAKQKSSFAYFLIADKKIRGTEEFNKMQEDLKTDIEFLNREEAKKVYNHFLLLMQLRFTYNIRGF